MSDIATRAGTFARNWGGLDRPPRLIRDRENAVFEAILTDGQRVALRLHRPGYQSADAIRSELIWTEALADAGFPCPRPVRSAAGELMVAEDGQMASCIAWIDAAPIGESGVASALSVAAQCDLYHRLGQLLRQLHDLTATLDLGRITRPRWDAHGFLGDAPLWGRFWENPSLSPSEAGQLVELRAALRPRLEGYDSTQLIHADALQENVLQNASGLHLIDFDDSGFGPLGYDLGAALSQHCDHPALPDLTAALVEGYGAMSQQEARFFLMLRTLASCGWIIARAAPDDPRQRIYAERAMGQLRRFDG